MKKIVIIISLLFFWTIFSQWNPISADSAQVTEYYHKVIKNDNMWDISKQYYKNPYKWHKLYRRNKMIYNPNLIFPGQFILVNRKVSFKTGSNRQKYKKNITEKKQFFNVDRSEFILKRKIAGVVKEKWNLKLSGSVIYLIPYKSLKSGEIITLVKKVRINLPAMYTIVKPIGYAKVIGSHKASVSKLFEAINGRIYFVLGKRAPIKIVKSKMRSTAIDILSDEPLSVFTNSTVWGRAVGIKNSIGEIVALKRGDKIPVLNGIITSQTGNIVGITMESPTAEYRNGIYKISK